MGDTLVGFIEWANEIMSERNITQADIARTGFVTSSAVSLLFSLRIKSVGVDMCRAISAAMDLPLAMVFEKAGLLPPYSGDLSPAKRKLIRLIEQADEETVELANIMIEATWDRKKRGKVS